MEKKNVFLGLVCLLGLASSSRSLLSVKEGEEAARKAGEEELIKAKLRERSIKERIKAAIRRVAPAPGVRVVPPAPLPPPVVRGVPIKERIKIWEKMAEDNGFSTEQVFAFLIFRSKDFMKGVRDEGEAKLIFSYLSAILTRSSGYEKTAKMLARNYKIHLMPRDDDMELCIHKLIMALKTNRNLQKLIMGFKVMITFHQTFEQVKEGPTFVLPRIVIYPSSGKAKVQEALNIIYNLFKDLKGLDIYPRFNAKVSSLIYVAQGEGMAKRGVPRVNEPKGIYYNPAVIPPEDGKDHFLRHPQTNEPLIN